MRSPQHEPELSRGSAHAPSTPSLATASEWLVGHSSLPWPPLSLTAPPSPPLASLCSTDCAHCVAEAEASSVSLLSSPRLRLRTPPSLPASAPIPAAISSEHERTAQPSALQLLEPSVRIPSPPATLSQTHVSLSWDDPVPVSSSPSSAIEHDPTTCAHCRAAADSDSAYSPLLSPASSSVPQRPSLYSSSAAPSLPSVFQFATPASPTTVEHRRSDAQRRLRERSAIERLDVLTSSGEEAAQRQTASALSASVASSARAKRKRDKRDKLTVLEACAARIERLERMLDEAQQDNAALSAELGVVVGRERQSAQWLDSSRSLDSAGLLSDRFISTQFDARSGRLLYANATFYNITGFTPSDVLYRLMNRVDPSSPSGPGAQQADPQSPFVPLFRERRGRAGGGESEPMERVPRRYCRQYPRTMQLFDDLFAGKRAAFSVVIRCLLATGRIYECKYDTWLVAAEWTEEADGRRWRRPATYAHMASVDDIVEVDSV